MGAIRAMLYAASLSLLACGPARAADELPGQGRYLLTFKVSQTTAFTAGPKTKRETTQRLIAFQGKKVLVSADTESARDNSFLGTEHTGPGKQCKKDGTAGVFCSTVSMAGNRLDVHTVYDFGGGTFLYDYRYTVAFTPAGCKVEKAGFSLSSTKLFEGSSGKLLSVSCKRL